MKRIWIMALALIASACAATPQPEFVPPRFFSMPPQSLGRSLSLSQLVTGEYGGKTYKMRYELEITPRRLAMVGLSPLGVTLFTIVHETGEPVVETLTKSEVEFDPRYTLFDVYLTYWPTDALRAALSRIGMRLEEEPDRSIRRVRGSDGDLIAEITYKSKNVNKGEILIQHFNFPYRLRIRTLEQ